MKDMWKDYSVGFIKKNRASSISVLVAAFISALFLSLLCGLFYNFWNYETESVVLEEGNWQGRISGAFEEDKVSEIENFANVKTAVINEDLSDEQTLVVDICFFIFSYCIYIISSTPKMSVPIFIFQICMLFVERHFLVATNSTL